MDAQEKLGQVQNEKFRVDSYKPQVRADEPATPPTQASAQSKVKEPTGKDKEWLDKNSDWFNKDGYEEMTGYYKITLFTIRSIRKLLIILICVFSHLYDKTND